MDEGIDNVHKHFMHAALKEACVALNVQEVPVGCVFVYNGEVIGRGSNKTNIKRDATRHAEFEAADMILLESGGKYTTGIFQHCTLYVTCEPCIMCAAALAILMVYGCGNDRFGGCGSVLDVRNHCCSTSDTTPYKCVAGILKQECINVLQRFYEQENPNGINLCATNFPILTVSQPQYLTKKTDCILIGDSKLFSPDYNFA